MRPRSVARRLGTFGIGAVVVGAVLVGTGVTVSARAVPHATAANNANKKKTTTTTTTSTLPPTTTTTQPCAAQSVTATSGGASLTAMPGTCVLQGTVVSLSGSGFTPGVPGTFLECNSDPNQPTVMYEGSPIPISCTNPLSKTYGPGVIVTSSTGTVGPENFTIGAGPLGPPCGPSQCTATSATDSSGGNPFTDAGKYPCPPTAAQLAINDTCQIIFGTQSASVTLNVTFNPNAPPPSTTPPTSVAPASSPSSVTKATAKPAATKASSGSLAFTGSGPALWWLALVGLMLMVLGIFALMVTGEPRRLARLVRVRITGSNRRTG